MSRLLRLNGLEFEVADYAGEFALLRLMDSGADVSLPRLGRAILEAKVEGLLDVIATEGEICLVWEKGKKERVFEALDGKSFELAATQQHWRLPVWFDEHEDFGLVCQGAGLSADEVMGRLLVTEYSVAMLGFVPGFVYMDGLSASLQIPRKSTPAATIPAGTLAIGGKYLGLYSLSTPAGWYAVGRVPVSVLDVHEMPPMKMSPGEMISLVRVTKDEYDGLLGSSLESFQEVG